MKNPSARFVMLHGVLGAGKSSLAERLSTVLIDRGAAVDLIPEEDIFTRSEFADVGRGYRTQAWPTAEVMLAAYARVIDTARRQDQWVIADWNCVSMIEDLPWAQLARSARATSDSEARADMDILIAHAQDVRRLAAALCPILLVLSVPNQVAVGRAATERGQPWVEHWAALAPNRDPNEPLLDRIVRLYDDDRLRRQDIMNAYRSAGWEVVEIDANQAREEVLRQAVQLLAPGPQEPALPQSDLGGDFDVNSKSSSSQF